MILMVYQSRPEAPAGGSRGLKSHWGGHEAGGIDPLICPGPPPLPRFQSRPLTRQISWKNSCIYRQDRLAALGL